MKKQLKDEPKFKKFLKLTQDQHFEIEKKFDNVESVVNYLQERYEQDDYDFIDYIKCNLDDSEDADHYNSTFNPNGAGNNVDRLVLIYNGKVLFETV